MSDPVMPPAGFEPPAGDTGRWLHPALTGERVLVRLPAAGDEAALVELATDPRVRRYLSGPREPAEALARVTRTLRAPGWGRFVIVHRDSGEVAGSGSVARKRGPWELSYQLRHRFWHQGLATEALALVRDQFFAHTGETLMIATTQEANHASRRLLQRLGAVDAGGFEDKGFPQCRYEFHRTTLPSPDGETRPVRVLMALHPPYYELIWDGAKQYEFRRRYLTGIPTSWFVYLTEPAAALTAVIDLDPAIVATPAVIAALAECTRPRNGATVLDYLHDLPQGFAMPIHHVREYPAMTLARLNAETGGWPTRGRTLIDDHPQLAAVCDAFTRQPLVREMTVAPAPHHPAGPARPGGVG